MFDWFKGKDKEPSNVVKFPTWKDIPPPKAVPPMPEVKPPKEEPARVYYRFGLTDNNRVAFQMGYSEITMSKQGCQDLIDQLTFFMNKIEDEDYDDAS